MFYKTTLSIDFAKTKKVIDKFLGKLATQVKSIFKGIEVVPQIMIEILIFTLWQGNGQLLGRNFYLFGVEIVWDDQSRVTALFGRPNLVTGLEFVKTGLIIVIHRSIILLGLDEAIYFNLFNYALQLTDLIIQTI